MPDPLYSSRYTQVFSITPNPTGPLAGNVPVDSNGKASPYVSAFMSDTDGSITIVGKEGPSDPVTFPVTAGTIYHVAIRSFLAVSVSMNVLGFL